MEGGAPPRPRRWRSAAIVLALALPGLVALAIHAARYWPFIADDALISLRYADRLLAGEGLTWTAGERVEGYSNLLWVLGCAALGLLRVDLIDAARILGALGIGGAIVCVAAWERDAGWPGRLGGAIGGLAVALTGAAAVWAIGGLEQPLVALLLALAVVSARPLAEDVPSARLALPAGALGLLCLTRPDGALLAGLVGLGLLLARGPSRPSLGLVLRLGLPSIAAVAGQLAFRLAYYGDHLPNTARAKLALTAERLASGWSYVSEGATWLWPLVALALCALWRPRRSAWLWAAPLVGWLAYVIFIGGDIFPGRRHLVPAVALLGFAIASGATRLLGSRRVVRLGGPLCALALAWQARLSAGDPANQSAIDERWEWEGEVVGRLLSDAFADAQPLVAVDPAGCIPYFSRLPALDMLGLNDRYLATHPPPGFGEGWLGHELGDGDYVWSRRPDMIVLCGPRGGAGACFLSGRQLLDRADFKDAYGLVTFEGRGPRTLRSKIWTRRDGAIGVRVDDAGVIVVPGFLLTGKKVVATLDDEGRIGAAIPAGGRAALRLPEAEGPGWSVDVDASGPARARIVRGKVEVRAEGEALHLRGLRVERVGGG